MLKLEEKDYDLNYLFKFSLDFAMLKEVLLKLAKSNQHLESKIKKLEESNKEKEKRISNLEDKLNIEYIPEEKSNSSSDDEYSINKKESINDYNNIESNLDKNKKSEEEKNKDENGDNEDIHNKDLKRSHSIKVSRKEYDNINSYVSFQVSQEAVRSLLKLIKENTNNINKLDNKLNKKIKYSLNDLNKKIKDIDLLNIKEHKIIEFKIRELNNNLYDSNDKIDKLIVKTAPIDNLMILKDNGNGTVDATKVMIQMLEDKINKKLEIIESKRIGGEINVEGNIDNIELKEKIDELENLINQINKEIELLKQNNNINNLNENNIDDSIKELKDLIDKKYNDLLIIIEELTNKLKNGDFIGEKMDDILKNIKLEKEKKTNEIIKKDYSNKKKKKINDKEIEEINEKLIDLKERNKDLNKKVNDIDNYFKNILNNQEQDISEIKNKIEEINTKLETKITNKDLKELYHTTDVHSDQLKYIQDKISELIDIIQKLENNNPNFVNRLETLTHEIFELKEKGVKEVQSKPIIDITKYIDENKLKETLKIYKENIEILMFEKDSLFNQIKEIQDEIKFFENKERVDKLDEELNEKINDLINKIKKRYIEKIELNKLLKNLELKIKVLSDNQNNKDSENWILAKQPIGCFNCASCEANIKSLSPTNEYLPWNRYPQGERQYHIGQGFSKLLQRISKNSEFKNYNNEKKEFSPENDINNNLYNSMTNINGDKNFIFKINNKENLKENNIFKINKKYKLPKVFFSNRRKKNNNLENIPLTDEENDGDKSFDSYNSPKLIKITKKKINHLSGQFLLNPKQKSLIIESNSKKESTSNKDNSKLERIKSLPLYENV